MNIRLTKVIFKRSTHTISKPETTLIILKKKDQEANCEGLTRKNEYKSQTEIIFKTFGIMLNSTGD